MKRIIEIFLVTLGLALSAGCSEFLDTVPDNRTTIDTPKKISQLLATAYPDRTYMTLIEHRCDGYTDFGSTFQGMQPDAAFDNVVSAFCREAAPGSGSCSMASSAWLATAMAL